MGYHRCLDILNMGHREMVHRGFEVDRVKLPELWKQFERVIRYTTVSQKVQYKSLGKLTWKRETSGEWISSISFFAGTNGTVIHD